VGIRPLLKYLRLNIMTTITGDSKVEDIAKVHYGKLNMINYF